MEDERIIDLYFERNESAIAETANKYGGYCRSIAMNILQNTQDSEECVNDTYISAWNTIPPKRPNRLQTYLGKLTRNRSLKMLEKRGALKRGGSQTALVLEELGECIPAAGNEFEESEISELLNTFLNSLSTDARNIFILRYWHMYSGREIAKHCKTNESKINVTLFRTRKKLKAFLEREGITI